MLRNFTGSTGVRAVIAVLMLLFVVACGSSNNGNLRQQRDDALAAAEKARMEAEAAAEKARMEAEAAAEKAEMERLAKIEEAKQAIAAATTAAGAQAAKDAVNDVATALEAVALQEAVDARIAALATMASADAQRMALMAAAGAIDTSDLMDAAAIAAANAAIAALEVAIAAAVDVDDTSMYQDIVDAAKTAVAAAQSTLDHASQTAALTSAVTALKAIDLTDLSTQEAIDAANAAIAAVRDALAAATELSAAEKIEAMTELATADRTVMMAQGRFDTAAQKMAIADAVKALGEIDLSDLMTQDNIDAAQAAIMALQAALDDATDLTSADKLEANVELTLAKRAVMSAQESLDENVGNQRMALMTAGTALAAIDLANLDTQEKIDAADAAVMALKEALDGATHLSDSEKATYQTQLDGATEAVRVAQTGMDRDERRTAQMAGLTSAEGELTTALAALDGEEAPTQAQIDAADTALAALNTAIEGAEDLTDAEKADAMRAVAVAEGRIAGAKQARMVADNAAAEEEKRLAEEKAKEMAATSAKLYAGISAQAGTAGTPAANDRNAFYNDANATNTDDATTGVPANSDADTLIMVSIGDGTNTPVPAALSEDKDTTVAANHGWEGKRYHRTKPASGGTYEAVVYSNVEAPKMGKKFGSAAAVTADGDFQYQLDAADRDNNANKALTIVPATHAARISLPSVTRTAGTETFELPEENPSGEQYITVSGMVHGVSGVFSCAPTTPADGCTAAVAPKGFTLGGGTWLFIPTDANARVTDAKDTAYASYGWWLHKPENDKDYTASAFVDVKGTVTPASNLNALNGTATYQGGAAGKYSLTSRTGGTNDAGHFTARATLEANFTANTATDTTTNGITGIIDQFIGADGEARDWEVELKGSPITDTGGIGDLSNGTAWTVGGTKSAAAGSWSGSLLNQPATGDGVPKVATGTFYSTFGTLGDDDEGRMVGAFGANKQ